MSAISLDPSSEGVSVPQAEHPVFELEEDGLTVDSHNYVNLVIASSSAPRNLIE
jgi:hypothetical protein